MISRPFLVVAGSSYVAELRLAIASDSCPDRPSRLVSICDHGFRPRNIGSYKSAYYAMRQVTDTLTLGWLSINFRWALGSQSCQAANSSGKGARCTRPSASLGVSRISVLYTAMYRKRLVQRLPDDLRLADRTGC